MKYISISVSISNNLIQLFPAVGEWGPSYESFRVHIMRWLWMTCTCYMCQPSTWTAHFPTILRTRSCHVVLVAFRVPEEILLNHITEITISTMLYIFVTIFSVYFLTMYCNTRLCFYMFFLFVFLQLPSFWPMVFLDALLRSFHSLHFSFIKMKIWPEPAGAALYLIPSVSWIPHCYFTWVRKNKKNIELKLNELVWLQRCQREQHYMWMIRSKIKKQAIMLGCYLRERHWLLSSSTGSNRLMQKHKWRQWEAADLLSSLNLR